MEEGGCRSTYIGCVAIYHPWVLPGLLHVVMPFCTLEHHLFAIRHSHFPKKNIIIIVAYEGQEESSTEEPEDEEMQKEEIKQQREIKQPRKQIVSQKRTRSIAYGKVY